MFFPSSINSFSYATTTNSYNGSPVPNKPQSQFRGQLGVYQEAQSEPLGCGSYGEVRLVQDIHTNQLYAMKIMNRHQLKEIQAEENINLEILIQSKLNHQNILKMVEVFGDHQNLYIVLEYCSKGNLNQHIKTHGTLTETQAFEFFYQILCGIDYLHSNNILHRDIKPENILINEDNVVKICDFNWAVQLDASLTASPVLCGTTEYMPPEVVTQKPHNFKTDVWSLGIVFYEMLHGDVPYKGRNNIEKINSIMTTTSFKVNEKLSHDAQILLHAMLSRQINQRPTIRQIFFSKWVKGLLSDNQLETHHDKEILDLKNLEQLSKSLNISLVKDIEHYQAMPKFKSDVKPVTLAQKDHKPSANPVKICGTGNIVARPAHHNK